MREICAEDNSFPIRLTVEELRKYFPKLSAVSTAGQYNDARRKHGVYVLDEGSFRMVHIKGPCPNWQNGQCTLGGNCISKVREADLAR